MIVLALGENTAGVLYHGQQGGSGPVAVARAAERLAVNGDRPQCRVLCGVEIGPARADV